MKNFSFFDIFEKSIFKLKTIPKNAWIVGLIIALLSGSLLNVTYTENFAYNNYNYGSTYEESIGENYYWDEDIYLDNDFHIFDNNYYASPSLLGMIGFGVGIFFLVILGIALIGALAFFLGILESTLFYYLYYYMYETILGEYPSKRRPLGSIVKANAIVYFKVILGLICFIIPGIILGIKYAPVTYILCKYPELTVEDSLSKTRELSKGYKWTIFGYTLLLGLIIGFLSFMVTFGPIPVALFTNSSLLVILSMAISIAVVTLSSVFGGVFSLYFYNSIENSKEITFENK